MKVFISKNALSKGIQEVELNDKNAVDKNEALWVKGRYEYSYYGKGEWHKTQQEAIEKVEQMRKAKIASLKKQIEKLEKLTF